MEYTKLVQTGGLLEVFTYQRAPSLLLSNRVRRRVAKDGIKAIRRIRKRRSDSISRACKSLRRIISGNLQRSAPALLTLTMLDLVDVRVAYKRYRAFGQRLRYTFGAAPSWVAVPEFQKRGAVHFHVLIWDIPYDVIQSERNTRYLQNTWGWGYVDILQTDGSEKLAHYLSKYLSKAMSDDRLIGVKAYSASRNIMRPVSIHTASAVDYIQNEFGLGVDNLHVYEATYDTLWLGRCVYRRYLIKQNGVKNSN